MESRPITGFILTLLGGLFILLGTLMGIVYAPAPAPPYAYVPDYYYPFLLTSGVCGVLVLLAAALMYRLPDLHVTWGVIALVLSVAGAVGLVTGYFALFGAVGVVFGLIGGAMALGWKSAAWGTPPPMAPVRLCPGCGRYIPIAYPYCAFCGTPAPSFHGGANPARPEPPRNP